MFLNKIEANKEVINLYWLYYSIVLVRIIIIYVIFNNIVFALVTMFVIFTIEKHRFTYCSICNPQKKKKNKKFLSDEFKYQKYQKSKKPLKTTRD